MVSLPAIKTLVLQASRLLKGAAVADRFEIAGVPCFVLSTAPAPELAAALKRQPLTKARPSRPSEAFLSRLSTINESEESSPHKTCASTQRTFAGSGSRYRQRDVILHLTGGGFFAHTIASDLPYLLDWSAATGAVVICPEYALLPEHIFPFALNQIVHVYSALRDGDAASELGFETNRIIVTGESAGGNLAAALCIKLGMEYLEKKETEVPLATQDETSCHVVEDDSHESPTRASTRMPDAMMLSCAALNLSLELSHSRVLGLEDPVLPSGLISAISDAYLPPHKGLSKQNPLASPFYASDNVLELFPPTLLFAGSKDPLLDDSVDFNERLRCLGVKSELRAAHNVPHAYWGLGTAGFPEAQQVQRECEEWLAHQFGLQPWHRT
jgi:acetyl esterase/lipase